MAIVKMKRLRVIALAAQRDELLQRLLHAGCVEVTEPQAELSDPEWTALLKRDTSALSDVKARQNAVNSALEALQKYAPEKRGLFIHRRSIREKEFMSDAAMNAALHSAGEINARVQRISQLYTQENRLTGQRASLTPWSGLDLPLNTGGTEHARVSFHTCPAAVDLAEVRQALAQAAPSAELFPVSADRELQYLLLMCHRVESETVTETVRPWSFSTVTFKDMSGPAAENIARIDRELEDIRARRDKTAEEIAAMAPCRRDLQVCADRLTTELSKESAKEKLLTNGTVVFLEGWVTEPGIPKAEAEMLKFACAWETAEPLEEEEPPILLHNPKWMTPINMVTEMYALPAYRGIDPNPLIFWFFLFFFGFMFADVAYGIIIWAVSFIIWKSYKPKGTMGYMFRLGQYMGISTFICGVFTGGFFGDVIPKVAEQMFGIPLEGLPQWLQAFSNGIIVNPINDPMTTLILAVVIGVVQLVFGQCIHIYMGFRDGTAVDSLLDVVPWWLFFASIGLVVAGQPWWWILVGCVILIATQGHTKRGFFGKLLGGVASLYDVTSWLSDILSYSRLMALMLATSVIASVMNTLGTLGGLSVGGIILFVAVFIIGHVFNVGVNIIGTYVHAARLQYLEFFGKFYEEGGQAFQPMTYNTKYVDIIEEE
ncbi:V-type ATPase 116kDa subunit family protein [Pseudoflavonifractor capillosus]|uniref:V-type ATP synthase subunit I n=1 Tax=Pseudoflavonifractor capillosus TaxID=106588 RepID=A0A921MKJ5_9FIRM|nr:V-type ATPase 116kDa subunit family protein [Pseudoflavonifractor capillosus]HJG86308.1 V-type ATP synthase subunit I [Pseudoflavonifractor capillosus]